MRRRQRSQNQEEQQGLFEDPSRRPEWEQLPSEVRRTVTELLARVLSPEQRQERARQAQEVENE